MIETLKVSIYDLKERKDYFSLIGLFLFLSLVVVLPFSFRLSALFTTSLICFSIFNFKNLVKNYKNGFLKGYTLHAFVVLFLLATLLYSNLQKGFDLAYLLNGFLIFPIIVLSFAHVLKNIYKVLLMLVVVSVSIAGLATLVINLLPPDLVSGLHTFTEFKDVSSAFGIHTPFMRRTQFSNFISTSVLISIFLFSINYYRRSQVLIIIWLLVFSFILGGRGAMLGMFGGLICITFFWIFPQIRRTIKPKYGNWGVAGIIMLFCLILFLLPIIAYKTIPPFTKRIDQTKWELSTLENDVYLKFDHKHFTTLSRFVSWQHHLEIIKEHPILGTGIGDYEAVLFGKYMNDRFEFPMDYHNMYMFFWGAAGIIALLLFLIDIAYWLRFLFRGKSKALILGVSFISCYLIIFIFDSTILAQMDNIFYHFIFCLIPIISISENEDNA